MIEKKENLANKIFDPEVIEAGKKIRDRVMPTKAFSIHMLRKDYYLYSDFKKLIKDNNINLNPEYTNKEIIPKQQYAGFHLLSNYVTIATPIFELANEIGEDPFNFMTKEIKLISKNIKNIDKKQIDALQNVKEETIKEQDKKITTVVKDLLLP